MAIYLLDSNILVYAADRDAPYHREAKEFRDKAVQGQISACISPTILTEFYAIVTDSRRVRNPLSPGEALREVEAYSKALKVIYPSSAAIEKLKELIGKYKVKRQQIFDLFIVATMLEHNVDTIYTMNKKDFSQFSEIQVETP
ncbi:MAG: type II toxin-antitoxin system VapC family toxin [Candidatus Bipolaricaulota bacterium]|nr:type II toxin-antitoxin system VapC family toxin [Candidatus Bipolaricaulota bacterium]MDW8030706.1 type II toxin-antitoxin system VapC family toxin [Candidatus Bipolaricaulota bacterium]